MVERSHSEPLTLLQITDTHLHATADSRMRGVRTDGTFHSVLDHVQRDRRWRPDAIVATGDIVQDESRAGYERFRARLEPLGVPVLTIPGNHDDPRLMAETLTGGQFQFCGERRLGPWALVLLSTFLAGEDAGGLGAARLAGLRKSLAGFATEHVLIFMHHHALPMGSAWLDGVALRDAADFWAIVDSSPNVRGVICGHVHQAAERRRGDLQFWSTPSTCAQFLPGSDFFALDDQPPGLRWITLHADGRIETEVAWVRHTDDD